MSISLAREDELLHRLTISGTARRADLDRVMHALADEIGENGIARLLVVLDGFTGWAAADDWSGLSFYVAHGDQIDRIAIVGDNRWREEAMMFALADLRRAPVQFFETSAMSEALEWLRDGDAQRSRPAVAGPI